MTHRNQGPRGHRVATLILATAALCALAPRAAEAAPATTAFAPSSEVLGTRLHLNGAGTRYKAVFKVYDMALYTTRKVGTPEDVLALPGPKKLQFTALREMSSTELGRLFVKGMSENATREQNVRHMPSSMRLIEIFSSRSKLMPGDSFAMEFVPGKGTQFVVQGHPQGEPVGDAEFFSMVLGIWFGHSPADRLLESALLGREAQATQP